MEKLVLIDGNSLINRAFYAMPVLTTKNGVFTNAVYGFINMFIKIQHEIKPDYIAVAFDLKAPTFRHKAFAEYKGTRKPMPEELRPQIPLLKEVLKLMGVTCIEQEGIEADDIIGTIAKNTSIMTYIYTGDKDSFQLVDEETTVCFTRRGITDIDEYNETNFTEKTGIKPIQIIDLKSLMGDSSDNIPGVPGVGEKTALALIQKYGSLEGVYENIENEKGKLKEKLELGKDLAFTSKMLATIKTDCNVDTNVKNMLAPKKYSKAVKDKFIELEFKSLYSKSDLFTTEDSQTDAITSTDTIIKPKKTSKIVKVEDLSSLSFNDKNTLTLAVTEQSVCVFDGETEYQISVKENLLSDGFMLSEILGAIKGELTPNKTLIVFDKKELMRKTAEVLGLPLTTTCQDVSLLKYLFDFTTGAQTLKDVIEEYAKNYDTPAVSLFEIYEELSKNLEDEDNKKLYYEIELPLVEVLFDMENVGFKVDYNALCEISAVLKEKLLNLEKEIRELTGEQALNVNSPKQLGEVLFNKLKIGKGKKTKSGFSTSAEVLESLEEAHDVVPLILEYRKIQKLQSTYVEGFKPLIDKNTGLIKTRFNQTVTTTGRLSSKEPNLQNIPVRDEFGKEIRKFFVPRESDGLLISADYSQIELRLLASFSGEKGLIEAYEKGIDIHRATASKVFKVKNSEVTDKMRSSAKAVNFGIIYGISEYGLAKNLKISPNEAKGYIEEYFKEYPCVKKYMEENVRFAREHGYAKTYLNRKRFIKEINSPNYALRTFGERAAMNMPLQGSSADIIKIAMLGVYNRLKAEGLKSKLILQVHDELIVDTAFGEEEIVERILKEEMEGAVSLPVKLTVETGKGKTWFEAK